MKQKEYVVFRTNEMLKGLGITYVTLYAWIREGMPTLKQNPYAFYSKTMDWLLVNKPKYKQQVEKMMEENNE